MNQRTGTLYLLPSGLGEDAVHASLPAATLHIAHGLRHVLAEDPKSARAFLKAIGHPLPLQDIAIATLDKNTPGAALDELLQPAIDGHDLAVVSEAGCPGVADPGGAIVALAHMRGVRVVPLVGPSAILLALMASGFNGQRFSFHGYLPIDAAERMKCIRQLENESRRQDMTQLFIETPYRNDVLLKTLIELCAPATRLCVAANLQCPDESVRSDSVIGWRRGYEAIGKRPAVFLLLAAQNPRGRTAR